MVKKPTIHQVKALRKIANEPANVLSIDGRTLASLLQNDWAAVNDSNASITPRGRLMLQIGPADSSVVDVVPRHAELFRRHKPISPATADLPADDAAINWSMLTVCCSAFEEALASDVVESIGGAIYIGSHAHRRRWVIKFCPFCGEPRGDVDLNIEEEN